MEKFYQPKESVLIFFKQLILSFGSSGGMKNHSSKKNCPTFGLDKFYLILILFFISALVPSQVMGTVSLEISENKAPGFAGGDGTALDPYQIETWYHLNSVRVLLPYHFILNNDLDENTEDFDFYASATANGNAGWQAIGTSSIPFAGPFDGNSKTISDFIMVSNDN